MADRRGLILTCAEPLTAMALGARLFVDGPVDRITRCMVILCRGSVFLWPIVPGAEVRR